MGQKFTVDWKQLQESAGPYPIEAFRFVRDGLAHTVEICHPEVDEENRHVDGRQLCMGLRDYAQKRYGLLARTVLGRWSIRRTEDFGRIVFAMVEAGLMRKADDDTIDDFVGVYDFDEEFGHLEAV